MADGNRLIFPRNPVEVVSPLAEQLVFSDDFRLLGSSPEEQESIDNMNELLRIAQMLGGYAGRANTAFIIPEDNSTEEPIKIHRFDNNVGFRGEMLGSWALKVGDDEDEQRIRTVCLVFQGAELEIEKLEDMSRPRVQVHADHKVQIPVFSVTEIEPLKTI